MKLLIVDDEALQLSLVRDVVASLRPEWDVQTAYVPETALEMLRTGDFDALMTDIKMPRIDGLELIARAQAMGLLKLKILILSGFSEFEYAKQAIRYQVCDYLLKPLNRDTIQAGLERLEAKVAEERPDGHTMLTFALQKSMRGIALNAYEQAALKGWQIESGALRVALLHVDRELDPEPFSGLKAAVPGSEVVPLASNRVAWVVPATSADNGPWRASAEQALDALGPACAGISAAYSRESLQYAYEAAVRMAENAAFLGDKRLIEQRPSRREPDARGQEADWPALRRALEEGALSVEALRRQLIERAAELMRANEHHFLNAQAQAEYADRIQERLHDADTLPAIRAAWKQMREEMASPTDNPEELFAHRCLDYIERHYACALTLGVIAEAFHYNESYFSARFTRAFGIGFARYLLRYRMERAGRLLAETDKTVAEIAQAVGVPNLSYFHRSFKEQHDVSPKRYRQFHAR